MAPKEKATLFKHEGYLYTENPYIVRMVHPVLAKTWGRHVPNQPSPLRHSTTPDDVDVDFDESISSESEPTDFEDVQDDFEPYFSQE